MEWNMIYEMIDPALLIVVAACWVIGSILKQTPGMPNWPIPYLVTLVAVVFACLLLGFSVEAVIQGILAGAVAVYGHQLLKQAKEAANKDE